MPEDLISPLAGYGLMGRKKVLLGEKIVRFSVDVQIAQGQIFLSPQIACKGLSICGLYVYNYPTSPTSLAVTRLRFLAGPYWEAFIELSNPAPGQKVWTTTPRLILADVAQLYIQASSTTGAYRFSAYFILSM